MPFILHASQYVPFMIIFVSDSKQVDISTMKMLREYGISMLGTEEEEEDHSTLITNALQSGRKIVLSEAGKYYLNHTQNPLKTSSFDLPPTSTTTGNGLSRSSSSIADNLDYTSVPSTSKSKHTDPSTAKFFESFSTKNRQTTVKVYRIKQDKKETQTTSNKHTIVANIQLDDELSAAGEPLGNNVIISEESRDSVAMHNPVNRETGRELSTSPAKRVAHRPFHTQSPPSDNVIVPATDWRKIELQLNQFQKENAALRLKLEQSVCMIAENRRRIEELEYKANSQVEKKRKYSNS